MKNENLHLINKIFEGKEIRTIWNKEEEKYYISVLDIITILTESKNPQVYWRVLKNRLSKEGNETVTNPSKNVEPIKQWLARLGKEKIDEVIDPSISMQKAKDLYRDKGYEEDWISKRIKSLQERKKLTDVWKENGVTQNLEYAILTNAIYKTWSGMTAKEYKEYKGLRKESLRDNMQNIELILTDLSEEATKRIVQKKKPQGLEENIKVAKKGGKIAKIARSELEEELGETIVNKENKLNYKYIDDKEAKK